MQRWDSRNESTLQTGWTLGRLARLLLTCLLLAALVPGEGRAAPAGRLLKGVDVESIDEGAWTIRLALGEPVRYLSQSPASEGRVLRVRVRSTLQMMRRRMGESLRLSTAQRELLEDVRLDSAMGDADDVLIEFSKPVHFSVSQGRDLEEIIVEVEAIEDDTLALYGQPDERLEPDEIEVPEREEPRPARASAPMSFSARNRRTEPGGSPARPVRRAPPAPSFVVPSFAARALRPAAAARPTFAASAWPPAFSSAARPAARAFSSSARGATFSASAESRASAFSSSASAFEPPAATSTVAFSSSPAFSSLAVPDGFTGFAARAGSGSVGPAAGRVDELLAEGRSAMTAGNADRAILLFTSVVEDSTGPRAAEARELLGLARQRNGQVAHAKAEYEAYLAEYPEGAGSERVRQRLDQLLTASEAPQPSVAVAFSAGRSPQVSERVVAANTERPAPRKGLFGFRNEVNGSISQSYRTLRLDTDRQGKESALASLDADVFLNTRSTKGSLAVRTNFAGTNRRALSSTRGRDRNDNAALVDRDDDELRVNSGFVELREGTSDTLARFGRQAARGSGILGRYDGLTLSKGLGEGTAINLVGGFPVDFQDQNSINTDRPFYGASLDIGPTWQYFSGQVYAIAQRVDGIEDRTAVGTELRYTHPRGSVLALVDYDTGFQKVGLATFVANARLDDRTTINAFVDVRQSPFLTAYNAIAGQGVDSIDDLRAQLSESQIRDLAEDRTAQARMFTLGLSRQLNDWITVGADATLSNLEDTSATAATPFAQAIQATPGTDDELTYTLQTTLTDLWLDKSFTTVALRYGDGTDNTRYGATVGGRYSLTDWLRINPELAIEKREFDRLGTQNVLRPTMRFELLWSKIAFDVELGMERRRGGPADQSSFYSSVGYRYTF